MKLLLRIPGKPQTISILVERGVFKKIPSLLKKASLSRNVIIVTDESVKKIFGKNLLGNLRKAGVKSSLISIPAAETSKSWKILEAICERMAELGAKRDSCMLALGGGVVGDVAGLAASIYMRGIPLVHVPTTLLAMVDSSVGGKTAIDLAAGKNLAGSTHQPKMIIMDTNMLSELPQRALKSSYAEIVKHAVIASRPLFHVLAKNIGRIDDPAFLEKIVIQNVKIKMKIIRGDVEESLDKKTGSRMLLNYGHTVGHAIEKLKNYSIPHGEAVAIGMVLENRIAINKKIFSEKEALLVKALLAKLGLPVKLPQNISLRDLERAMKTDKKVIGGKLMLALPRKIGRAEMIAL